jgi:hypothetical protein
LKQRYPDGPPALSPTTAPSSPRKPPTAPPSVTSGRSSPERRLDPNQYYSDRKAPSAVSTDEVEASETMSYLSMEVGAGSLKVS